MAHKRTSLYDTNVNWWIPQYRDLYHMDICRCVYKRTRVCMQRDTHRIVVTLVTWSDPFRIYTCLNTLWDGKDFRVNQKSIWNVRVGSMSNGYWPEYLRYLDYCNDNELFLSWMHDNCMALQYTTFELRPNIISEQSQNIHKAYSKILHLIT